MRRETERETLHASVDQSVQETVEHGQAFLTRKPVHASRSCMPEMRELLGDGRVHLVQGPLCRWRMTARDDGGEQGFVREGHEMSNE